MIDALAFVADFALFVLTVAVVGKRPTAVKVAGMIALVWIVDYGYVVYAAMQMQMTPVELYQQMLDQAISAYDMATGGRLDGYEATVATIAGVSPAIYLVQSASYVFVGLCLRWIADRVRKRSLWSPFSKVDLSIWWLMPLVFGLGCYCASLLLPETFVHSARMISANVLIASVIPLFVQGAACGKGIMNRAGLGFAWQLVLGVLGIISGILFVVWPVLGLIDFWANFRKLPRDGKPSAPADAV